MNKKYDLEERTAKFGEDVINFLKTVEKSSINNPLISQLVRSATSIGANYMEADGAQKKISNTKLDYAKKNQKKQNIGLE